MIDSKIRAAISVSETQSLPSFPRATARSLLKFNLTHTALISANEGQDLGNGVLVAFSCPEESGSAAVRSWSQVSSLSPSQLLFSTTIDTGSTYCYCCMLHSFPIRIPSWTRIYFDRCVLLSVMVGGGFKVCEICEMGVLVYLYFILSFFFLFFFFSFVFCPRLGPQRQQRNLINNPFSPSLFSFSTDSKT